MDSRSGGKIVTKRYRRHNATPYDRVLPAAQPAPKDPNWIARVIIPATRVIASGASKILSSVFDSDSSSSTSLSGDASENDDVVNNEVHDNGDGVYSLIKDHGRNNDKSSDVEQVEQLLMNGKFSREECDRFIEIIKSRALDNEDECLGTDNSDKLRSKAVMEAKKWLDSKKVESNPMIDMGADEFGSPADVAKHYLKSRSPWLLSPSSEHFEELQTPTTMAASPFQEGGASMAAASHEFSSLFKKRSSLASGSWNIQDEIRSVRAKATEDLLKSSPSTRNRNTMINSSISGKEGKEKELILSKDLDTASTIAEKQTVLAIPIIPLFEKHNPKILDEENTAASDLHSNDPKDSKADEEIGKLEETQVTLSVEENVNETIVNVTATTTEYESANDDKRGDETIAANVMATTTEYESANDDKRGDETIAANVTAPTEHGSAFLSEASVEVTVMEETDSMANVSLMNSDNKLVVDKAYEVPSKEEAKKPVRSSSRRGGGQRGGRGRVKRVG